MANIRQARPDFGLGIQVKILEKFSGVASSLSGTRIGEAKVVAESPTLSNLHSSVILALSGSVTKHKLRGSANARDSGECSPVTLHPLPVA